MFNYLKTKAVAVNQGHEVELLGDFGTIKFSNGANEMPFTAFKVTFKFPGEHKIDG